jgi:DNA-binding beta-propeller fold protein YncE
MNFTKLIRTPGAWKTAGCLLALALAARATAATKPAKDDYVFFPGPPDEPHLQFLTAFSSEQEMGRNTRRSFGTWLTGQKPRAKQISKPYGGAVRGHTLYVCDTDYGAVLKADLQERSMSAFNARGQGVLKVPLNLAFDAAGNFYIVDSGRNQVVIFDRDENYVAALGKAGEMKPRDVAVSQDRIYVADMQGQCVRVYDKATRKPLFTFPRKEDVVNEKAQLHMPTNLALDGTGHIYVSDTGAFRIGVYDAANGAYVRSVGEMGDSLGQFARVKGIAVDRAGRLYAADAMSQVVQLFDDKGKLLTLFADPNGSAKAQSLPTKVVVDYDNVASFKSTIAPGFKVEYLVFVLNQIGPHLVSVYGFGHQE